MEGLNVIDSGEAVFNQGYNACLKDVLRLINKWDMEFKLRNIREVEALVKNTPVKINYDRPLIKRMLG